MNRYPIALEPAPMPPRPRTPDQGKYTDDPHYISGEEEAWLEERDRRERRDAAREAPMQPVISDEHGTVRFKANAIVAFLLDNGPFDMNRLARLSFSDDDRRQFAQLIGYSVSSYGDLSYTEGHSSVEIADAIARRA